MRRVPADCMATVGQVSNAEHALVKLGKAGPYPLDGPPASRPRLGDEPG